LKFPFQQDDKGPVTKCAVGVEGLNVFCPECGEKMHIKAKDIPHMSVIYNKFQQLIDSYKEQKKKIIIMPGMDRFASTFLQDIKIDQKIVEDVYDTREFRIGDIFLGKKVKKFDDLTKEKLTDKAVVILPWVEYEKVYEKIEGFSEDVELLSWNKMFL